MAKKIKKMNCNLCLHRKSEGGYCGKWKTKPEKANCFRSNNPKKTRVSEDSENTTCADDYLDYLSDRGIL